MALASRALQRWFGRPCAVPAAWREELARVFTCEPDHIDRVVVRERSLYAAWHGGATATTRPGLILLAGSADDFWADADLVLHEYFHVLRQWSLGMTRTGYLIELARRGYRRHRREVEAIAFARSHAAHSARRLSRG